MKTVFANHREVCKKWAEQSQQFGRAGNITFDGALIYSYGWWPMARIHGDVCLLRSDKYSVSTSQHQTCVWRAVYGRYRLFHVPFVTTPANHDGNIKYYVQLARETADSFWNCRFVAKYLCDLYHSIVENAKLYAEHYHCTDLLPPLWGLELSGPKAKAKLRG